MKTTIRFEGASLIATIQARRDEDGVALAVLLAGTTLTLGLSAREARALGDTLLYLTEPVPEPKPKGGGK